MRSKDPTEIGAGLPTISSPNPPQGGLVGAVAPTEGEVPFGSSKTMKGYTMSTLSTAVEYEFTPVLMANCEVTKLEELETVNGKKYLRVRLEQFTREINGKFQFSVIADCWIPELFDEVKARSKSGMRHSFTGKFRTSSNSDKSKYYTNFTISSL